MMIKHELALAALLAALYGVIYYALTLVVGGSPDAFSIGVAYGIGWFNGRRVVVS